MRSDGTLKKDFRENSLTHFRFNVRTELPVLTSKYIKYLLAFCYAMFILSWDLIFRTVGSEIEEEEEAWSRRWHEIKRFIDSAGCNTASVVTRAAPFLSLSVWGKTYILAGRKMFVNMIQGLEQ